MDAAGRIRDAPVGVPRRRRWTRRRSAHFRRPRRCSPRWPPRPRRSQPWWPPAWARPTSRSLKPEGSSPDQGEAEHDRSGGVAAGGRGKRPGERRLRESRSARLRRRRERRKRRDGLGQRRPWPAAPAAGAQRRVARAAHRREHRRRPILYPGAPPRSHAGPRRWATRGGRSWSRSAPARPRLTATRATGRSRAGRRGFGRRPAVCPHRVSVAAGDAQRRLHGDAGSQRPSGNDAPVGKPVADGTPLTAGNDLHGAASDLRVRAAVALRRARRRGPGRERRIGRGCR